MIRKHFILFSFAVLLLSPVVIKYLFPNNNSTNIENRELAKKPTFQIINDSLSCNMSLKNYSHEYEQYYNDNYILKNQFTVFYNELKLKMRSNPLEKSVVIGKDGWFYLGNEYALLVDKNLGYRPLSKEELEDIKNSILRKQHSCDSLGIKFIITLAPDKQTIYPEYYPFNFKKKGLSRIEQVDELLKSMDINYINIIDTLKNHKMICKENIYHKKDSHWNFHGAWAAYTKIFTKAHQLVPDIKCLTLDDITIIEDSCFKGMDLAKMLSIDNTEYVDLYRLKEHNIEQIETATQEKYENHYLVLKFHAKNANVKAGKIALYGDSFCNNLYELVAGSCHELFHNQSIGDIYFDKELLEREKPDILIYEIVERYVDVLSLI